MTMDEDRFWRIIERSFSGSNPKRELDAYGMQLSDLPRIEVIEFQRLLNSIMARAYSWDLIGAACFLGCGQSDDGFEDFRGWLISRGRSDFEAALADCNVIASFDFVESPTEEWHLEELHLMPGEIGGEEEDEEWPYSDDPASPHGKEVELSQEALKRRFPVLWERFGNRFMIGIR